MLRDEHSDSDSRRQRRHTRSTGPLAVQMSGGQRFRVKWRQAYELLELEDLHPRAAGLLPTCRLAHVLACTVMAAPAGQLDGAVINRYLVLRHPAQHIEQQLIKVQRRRHGGATAAARQQLWCSA